MLRAPTPGELAAVASEFPDAHLQFLGTAGKWLSHEPQDVQSFRYLIINMGAGSYAELIENHRRALALLPNPFGPAGSMVELEKD